MFVGGTALHAVQKAHMQVNKRANQTSTVSSSGKKRIPKTEVLERAKLPSVGALLGIVQLRWARYVIRVGDERYLTVFLVN